MGFLWIGMLGNLTNYGLYKISRGFAFVWSSSSLPNSEKDITDVAGSQATPNNGAEIFEFLDEAIYYASVVFEELDDDGALLRSLKSFESGGL